MLIAVHQFISYIFQRSINLSNYLYQKYSRQPVIIKVYLKDFVPEIYYYYFSRMHVILLLILDQINKSLLLKK